MNDKSYNFIPYQSPQCLKQVTDESQIYYNYNNFSVSNSSSTANYVDLSNVSCQNMAYHQNSISTQQGQYDSAFWENRILSDGEKNMKILDKGEAAIEISTKDLSPSTYCSNIDLIISESYKQSASKDINPFNKFDEWCYSQTSCDLKSTEYSSCAQEKLRRCTLQKHQDVALFYEASISSRTNNKSRSNEMSDYPYNYYDNKFIANPPCAQNNFFNVNLNTSYTPIINPIDQLTECSNEESDIIVEESDEEVTDYIDDSDKQLQCQTNKCLVCNGAYKPLGTQFYLLTALNPLTMCTQKPVIQTLINIVGEISTKNYLCGECLGLINNIDHLLFKLEKLKFDLGMKFKRTCLENKVQLAKKKLPRARGRKSNCISKFPKLKCKLCKKILCLKTYCHYHLKKHKNQDYLCDICGMIYSNKKKFILHRVQHQKKICKKIDSFKCSNCDKIFRTRSNQKEHQNYCLGILPFKCKHQYCDKKFPSTTKLKNHVKLKHDKKFVVICSICNIGFVKVSDYKTHIVSHSAVKKYSCSICSKSYKTLSNLNFHIKVHSNTLPFNCHICKKGFMRKEYLETHINNHNGVKNFSCMICEKKFVSQKNLDAHLKYHEGTVKKNTCNICGKTMTSGFEEHLRIHNNLKEFECEYCNMKFNTKGTFSKHIKRKHKNLHLFSNKVPS